MCSTLGLTENCGALLIAILTRQIVDILHEEWAAVGEYPTYEMHTSDAMLSSSSSSNQAQAIDRQTMSVMKTTSDDPRCILINSHWKKIGPLHPVLVENCQTRFNVKT